MEPTIAQPSKASPANDLALIRQAIIQQEEFTLYHDSPYRGLPTLELSSATSMGFDLYVCTADDDFITKRITLRLDSAVDPDRDSAPETPLPPGITLRDVYLAWQFKSQWRQYSARHRELRAHGVRLCQHLNLGTFKLLHEYLEGQEWPESRGGKMRRCMDPEHSLTQCQ